MALFTSERYFILFDYFPSHKQLLLRAQKSAESGQKNIDVIFSDVHFLHLSPGFRGLTIRWTERADRENLSLATGIPNRGFILSSEQRPQFIAASLLRIVENELDFNQTSLGLQPHGKENQLFQFADPALK